MSQSSQDDCRDPEEVLLFGLNDLYQVRDLVRCLARLAGFSDERTDDLVLAVHEIAVCAFAVDDRPAMLLIGDIPDGVVCEIRETAAVPGSGLPRPVSRLTDPAVGPGRGWRIARALCDEIVGSADGSAVQLSMRLAPGVDPMAGPPAGPSAGAGRRRFEAGD
ncbi:ATP-binding protein [Streptacidiphilus sp. PAMC 29251]